MVRGGMVGRALDFLTVTDEVAGGEDSFCLMCQLNWIDGARRGVIRLLGKGSLTGVALSLGCGHSGW